MWESLRQNWALLLPLATGALAVLTLLPQPRRWPSWIGIGLLIVTFGLACARIGSVAGLDQALFYGFSFVAIVSGLLLVTQTQPARAALSFTLVVLATSGLFLLLAAPFLFAASIIVYAGAIVVTFLFVLMLAQQTGRDNADLRSREPLLSAVTGFVLLGTLFYLIQRDEQTPKPPTADPVANAAVPVVEFQRLTDLAGRAAAAPSGEILRQLVETATVEDQGMKKALPQLFKERFLELSIQEGTLDPQALLFKHRKMLNDRIETEFDTPWLTLPQDNTSATLESRRTLLRKLHDIGIDALALVPRERARKLSTFSGPVGVPASDLRRGPDGVPALPAQNAAYLGKSLFTDYLLAVELGGILLLVAVVGAIVIAQRQDEQGKEIA